MDRRRTQPKLEGLVLDADLSLMLPTVNRGRVGNQSLLDVHGVVTGRPAGAFVAATNDHATIEEALITQFPFVVEGKFRTSNAGANCFFWCGDKSVANDYFCVFITGGDVYLRFDDGATDQSFYATSLADNVTHHLGIQAYVDGAAVKVEVWVDGAKVATVTNANWNTTFWSDIAADRTAVGRFMDLSQSSSMDGKIWDARIYNGVDATDSDMLRLYDGYRISGVTPTAEWKFSEGTGAGADAVADTSGNGKHLTTTGMGWDLGENGGDLNLTAAGRVFNGASDYIEVVDNASLRVGTDPFQIHTWAKFSSSQVDANPTLIAKGTNGAGEWTFYGNGGDVGFIGDSSIAAQTGSGIYFDDAWHLFSVLRNGNDLSVLVDGVSVATDATAGGDLNTVKAVQIGAAEAGATTFFTGPMKRVRIHTADKTIAQGTLDALAIFNRGPNA